MTEKTLTNGTKVLIRKLSRPEIREIRDLGSQRLFTDGSIGMVGANKVIDAWIDKGVAGLGDWAAKNGEVVPDDIVMQLDEQEQFELSELIKAAQVINPTKPLSSD